MSSASARQKGANLWQWPHLFYCLIVLIVMQNAVADLIDIRHHWPMGVELDNP